MTDKSLATQAGILQRTRDILLNTYITSISEHDDSEDIQGRLSMWRAFGASSTTRVAIVYKLPKNSYQTLALNLMFSPVAYLNEDQAHGVMREVIGNINKNCDFLKTVPRPVITQVVFSTFQAAVVCLKHEGFREEREWRAIYSPSFLPSTLMESSIEVIGGVPQTVYKIPLDVSVSNALSELDFTQILERVIVGPTSFPWAIGDAFMTALKETGIPESRIRVVASNIPLRT